MTNVHLPGYGDVYFEETGSAAPVYTTIITDYQLDGVIVCLKISSDVLNEQTMNIIEDIVSQLEKMDNASTQAYLHDFNDEEEVIYTDNIYQAFLGEVEFESLKQQTTAEQRLLLSVNLTSIDIDLRKEDTSVIFNYIKGYELTLLYKFNRDCKLKEMIFKPGASIIKERLSLFIDKWEQPEMNEICSRFKKDWHNYPVRSYFIYLMAKRIRSLCS